MKNINKIFQNLVTVAVFTLMVGAISTVSAATLEFDPESAAGAVGTPFSVEVKVDAGTDEVAGTDIYISYDDSQLELQSVTAGDYFPLVNNIPSSDRVYISGVVANQGEFQTGIGTVATLTFEPLKSGTAELTFDCDQAQTDTSKIVQNDINATNIIECGANGSYSIIVEGDDSDDSSTTGGSSSGTGGTTQLPQSGVYENVVQFASWGSIMLIVGIGLRILMRML